MLCLNPFQMVGCHHARDVISNLREVIILIIPLFTFECYISPLKVWQERNVKDCSPYWRDRQNTQIVRQHRLIGYRRAKAFDVSFEMFASN